MKRMYWTHPEVFESEVQVTAAGPCQVLTDPILFHPEEGGQPADRGAIGGAVVQKVGVVEGRVVHTLDRPLPEGRHMARLDREHRLYTATHHTAQHILSGIAARQFGLQTTGVHIGLASCTVDFDAKVDWDVAAELERRTLEAVTLNIPVETVFGAEDAPARSRFDRIEADVIRLVKIGDYDTSACCGAHVAATGRLGAVRIFDLETHKKGTRVSFLAAGKALEQAQAQTAILRELRKTAGCASAELPAAFQSLAQRAKELTKELDRVWLLRLADLAKSVETVQAGAATIGVYVGELPTELVPTLAALIADGGPGAGLVVSETRIAIVSRTLDAGGLLKGIHARLGGKGGGSPRSAGGKLDRPVTAAELAPILAGYR